MKGKERKERGKFKIKKVIRFSENSNKICKNFPFQY